MVHAYSVLERCFWIYLFISAIMLLILAFAVKGARSNAQGVRAIIIGIVLIVFLVTIVIPCGMDFLGHNVIQENGIYRNYDNSNRYSGRLGIHSVILETENGETVKLTTIPSLADDFPIGSFMVVAYYSQRSRILLHIEIVEAVLDKAS